MDRIDPRNIIQSVTGVKYVLTEVVPPQTQWIPHKDCPTCSGRGMVPLTDEEREVIAEQLTEYNKNGDVKHG